MATTPEQRARRAAQRANAARLRENERRKAAGESRIPLLNRILTSGARRAQYKYGDQIINGQIQEPMLGEVGSKTLASLASKADLGKAPDRFLVFRNHWYHMAKDEPATEIEVDIEYEEPEDEDDIYPEE